MLRAAIKFARIRIVATCLALVLLGNSAAGGLSLLTVAALVLVILVNIHANSINDYTDRDIDALNLKGATDRPFVSGDISLRHFWWLHGMSTAAILCVSLLYGPRGMIGSCIILLIDYAYSVRPLRLSSRPLLSPLVLSAAYVFYSFTFGYWSYPSPHMYPWLLTVGLCTGFIARLLLKDFRDIHGDKKYHKITFLIRYGAAATMLTSGLFFAAGMLLVSWSFEFDPGITTALVAYTVVSSLFLLHLGYVKTAVCQQYDIAHIASLANSAILIVMVYLLCKSQPGITTMTGSSIVLIVSTALLGRVLLDYFLARPSAS